MPPAPHEHGAASVCAEAGARGRHGSETRVVMTPEILRKQAAGRWTVDFDETRLVFGAGAARRLGELTAELGCANVLLVSDKGVRGAGHVDAAVAALEASSTKVTVFDDVPANPGSDDVEAGRAVAAGAQVDGLVAVGGGSALDCARGINFVLTGGGRMEDYWGVGKARAEMLPSLAVPTTAGTGSDAQSFALISHAETRVKMACGDRRSKFRVVILDPLPGVTAPREVTAIAGLDALSHAVESYVCTRRSPMSQQLARGAWKLLESNFERVLDAPDDVEARGAMLMGSHLAGAAIEHSMLGAAHACANPLTARFGIVHGVAVLLMLPHVMELNESVVGKLYAELGGDSPQALRRRVEDLRAAAGVPTTPSARNAAAQAAPIPDAPPVITATWRASGFSAPLPSFACSSDQYSISNMSGSGITRKALMASAAAITSTLVSARSAATLASFFVAPRPNSPSPGTRISRGTGSSSVLGTGWLGLLRAK